MRRNPWLVVVTGVIGLIVVLLAGAAGYWRYANQLPVYPPPNIVMPLPNAHDDFVAAGQMAQAAGGSTVLAADVGAREAPRPMGASPARPPGFPGPGRSPAPALRNGRPVMAYEPDVPLPQVRAVAARNRPALAQLRQGFRQTYRNPPVVSFSQPFPELAQFRELSRVLVTEGKLAEREGRPNAAARSYLDCLHLGVDVPRGGPLIHGLVGLAIESIGLQPLQEVVDRLDGPTAAAAARQMVRLDATASSYADTLTAEKVGGTLGILEILRQSRSWQHWQKLTGSTGSSPSGQEILTALAFSFTPKKRMVDNYRGYMDALIANARRPYYAQAPPPPVPNDPLNRILLPVFGVGGAQLKWAQRDAQWRITIARLAARAYEQEHGALPSSLEALVPAYLPAVPQDPFTAKPLVCRLKGDRALIYSRGPDGDDDGGTDLGANAQPGQNGDIISLKRLKRP